jgi:hypothetical protein
MQILAVDAKLQPVARANVNRALSFPVRHVSIVPIDETRIGLETLEPLIVEPLELIDAVSLITKPHVSAKVRAAWSTHVAERSIK